MKIIPDEPKRLANLDKHGLDQGNVDEWFVADAVVVPARAGRFKAIGKLHGRRVAVIFKPLGSEAFSIISLRSASKKQSQLR